MIDNYLYTGWVYRKRVFDTGKTPVTRVTLTSKRFIPGRNGEPGKNVPHYVTAVAFGKMAEMLAKVDEKAVITIVGEPVAGKPYQDKESNWVSQLEIKIAKWSYVDLPEGAGRRSSAEQGADESTVETVAAAPSSGNGAGGGAPAYGDDPFQDEF